MKHLQTSDSKDKSKPKVTLKQAFKTIIWPRRKLVFLGLILIIIRSLAGFVLPLQSKVLLDEVVPEKDYSQLYTLIIIVISAIFISSSNFLFTN